MTTLAEDLALFNADITHEETLTVALAMIDELDFDSLTQTLAESNEFLAQSELLLTGGSSDPSSPSSPATSFTTSSSSPSDASASKSLDEADAQVCRPKRQHTRREQLIELRSTVDQLETKLEELLESKRSPHDELWKAIVTTQLVERQRAELENLRLRWMMNENLSATRHLKQVLFRKRPTPYPEEPTSTQKRARARKGISRLEDPAIENELMNLVDTMYADVDKLLSSGKLRDASDARCRISERRADEVTGAALLEAVDSRVYPFEYHATAGIMWQMFVELVGLSDTAPQERIDEGDNMVTRLYDQEVDLAMWHGQFRVKVVGRRIVEADRIIHIACMLMDPVELGGKQVDGLCIRRRIIDVIEPAPIYQAATPATLKRTYVVVEPGVYDAQLPDSEQREGVGMLTKFALMSGKAKCNEKHQDLENRLVDSLGKMTLTENEQGTEQNV
ncbi:hypothetical protein Poli38472_011860 [Pythium oligandrum]|uniref:Uncharacterized protein n=1 Tax=Pythium oligandrum TaxID=41045 RepID=A0A8K1C972_PYTOL|nr:hypothetical protein Poli38472_011860 [Pythium oligandrum]|eukprot:TMW58272.1 hypothetical protein Poli38472_011860 [Pythium oligandrum]